MGSSAGNVVFDVGSLGSAWMLCIAMSSFFVGVLYTVSEHIRLLKRDNPIQIRARFVRLLIIVLACTALLSFISSPSNSPNAVPLSTWLGFPGSDGLFTGVVCAVFLTAMLFAGPICCLLLITLQRCKYDIDYVGTLRPLDRKRGIIPALLDELRDRSGIDTCKWVLLRNLVVGPVVEEYVYRGCILPLLICNGSSKGAAIALCPLLFGLAHLHHAKELLKAGHSLQYTIIGTLIQLTYTTAFGAYAAFIHMRTGHLLATVACHALCNFMGLPDLSFRFPPGDPNVSGALSSLHSRAKYIWCVYGAGIILFCAGLGPLTSYSAQYSHLWQVDMRQT